MNDEKKLDSSLANLSQRQQDRLKSVTDAISVEKITVSHSLEVRTLDGRKMSAFYSVSTNHRDGEGFTPDDTKLARLILGRHVVASVYDDAVKRGMMSASVAQEEVRTVIARYENGISKLLSTIEET